MRSLFLMLIHNQDQLLKTLDLKLSIAVTSRQVLTPMACFELGCRTQSLFEERPP